MTENAENRELMIRVMIMAFVVMLMLFIVILRLWNVQVLSGQEFDEKANRQYARSIRLPALRGRIFSSDGLVLAGNRPSACALLHLSEMPVVTSPTERPKEKTQEKPKGILERSVNAIYAEIRRMEKVIGRESLLSSRKSRYEARHFSGISPRVFERLKKKLTPAELAILYHMFHYPGIPMEIFKDLDLSELAKLAEITPAVPGLELSASSIRHYPYGALACHIIGYTVTKDPSTAEDRGEFFYYLPDTAGNAGLERSYDKQLQGKPGRKLVKVNHRGFVHEVIGEPQPAESSSDLILTLNARLQARAENLLRGREGAIVMMDASDGSILAAGSAPGFDLNQFRRSPAEYRKLSDSPGHPFLNKVFQGVSMPGSIVKPLVALAILESGVKPEEEIECDGATHFADGSRIRCWAWQSGGHGELSLLDAIKVSCNDFFIENGMKLGIGKLRAMYASAGIGSPTGVGLPESRGILPGGRRWPNWNVYDTALVSIGQGKIQLTPIQAVSYAAALANGGKLWTPRLVREVRNPETGRKEMIRPVLRGRLQASPENIEIVRDGMFRAVNDPGGGAARARLPGLTVYGKTGTAEVGSKDNRTKNTWFIGFAKLPSGRLVAVAVLVFKGEAGNRTAAPLAAEMLRFADGLKL